MYRRFTAFLQALPLMPPSLLPASRRSLGFSPLCSCHEYKFPEAFSAELASIESFSSYRSQVKFFMSESVSGFWVSGWKYRLVSWPGPSSVPWLSLLSRSLSSLVKFPGPYICWNLCQDFLNASFCFRVNECLTESSLLFFSIAYVPPFP